ncbi:hypothetical protein V8G54_024304 [Vigna mungo]|uniref:Uncharacterized protein n=1 Tax=Vigna mungo TaxID=3915 RepID=A0AAQ3RSF1_VIGMU
MLEMSGLEAPETFSKSSDTFPSASLTTSSGLDSLFSLDNIESLFSDVPLLEDPSKLLRTFLAMSASSSKLSSGGVPSSTMALEWFVSLSSPWPDLLSTSSTSSSSLSSSLKMSSSFSEARVSFISLLNIFFGTAQSTAMTRFANFDPLSF